ncbi:MAG: class I SAM-dependent methyltransferase [Caldisericia bacterium]|nr:class I SAM-dependent methyltransferase [Caldisericia bacterium]
MNNGSKIWDSLAGKYDEQVIESCLETYENIIEKSHSYLKSSNKLLDIGCGTGITTMSLSKDVKKTTAVDYSQNMISIAKNKAKEKNIDNIYFSKTPFLDNRFFPASFDTIMAINYLPFEKNIDETLVRIKSLLKNNGTFILTIHQSKTSPLSSITSSLLSKLSVAPYQRTMSIEKWIQKLEKHSFELILSEEISLNPLCQFISVKKHETKSKIKPKTS